MTKSIVISERDNIAAVQKDGKVVEFFIHRGDMLLGDVYLASVENILPSIDAAFVNLGGERMGFLHASDVIGKGALKDKLQPKQKVLVQIMKEPTGNKGPRVTTQISLPGRFLVLMPDEKGVNVSRKILSPKERGRLKSIVSLLKPAGVGVIIRTEAEEQAEQEIQDDLEFLMEKWSNIVTAADTVEPPNLLYRDQDLLYRVIREACTEEVKEIIVDTPFALHRTNQLLQSWNMGNGINVNVHKGNDSVLIAKGVDKEIRTALQTKVNLPCGGYLYIQTTEALTVVDVNSGKFTSSATQNETIRKTNLEAITEIARQLRLRNIGGMIIIDFIDMENRVDKLAILEELEQALEPDKGKPQVGQLSDLGLVELTRHRQGQSLAEIFTKKCPACNGTGAVMEELNFVTMPVDADFRQNKGPQQRIRMPQRVNNQQAAAQPQQANAAPTERPQQRPQRPQAEQADRQQKPLVDAIERQQKQPQQERTVKPKQNANEQENKKHPQADVKYYQLNEVDLKKYMSKVGIIPNYSKHVKFATVPPGVARKHFNSNYIVDVFTILKEIESAEANAIEKIAEEAVKLEFAQEAALNNSEANEANEANVKIAEEVEVTAISQEVTESEPESQHTQNEIAETQEVQVIEPQEPVIQETIVNEAEVTVIEPVVQEESTDTTNQVDTNEVAEENEEAPKATKTRKTGTTTRRPAPARRGRPKAKKEETAPVSEGE
ncbi:MAG: Rne/Rng family ribonuclease [bacterium]